MKTYLRVTTIKDNWNKDSKIDVVNLTKVDIKRELEMYKETSLEVRFFELKEVK